jgi:hypothetical protein
VKTQDLVAVESQDSQSFAKRLSELVLCANLRSFNNLTKKGRTFWSVETRQGSLKSAFLTRFYSQKGIEESELFFSKVNTS